MSSCEGCTLNTVGRLDTVFPVGRLEVSTLVGRPDQLDSLAMADQIEFTNEISEK